MSRFLCMGLFALVVVGVSLWRILAERELPRLRRIKLLWGRTLGLGIHFVANVGIPLIVGIVFVSMGAADLDTSRPAMVAPLALPSLSLVISQPHTPTPEHPRQLETPYFPGDEMLMP